MPKDRSTRGRDRHKRPGRDLLAGGRRAIAASSLALAIAFAAVFLVNPRLFRVLAAEDGPVEWASALLPLLASMVFARAALTVWRAHVTEIQEFFIALGLLALAMEVSSPLQDRYATALCVHNSLVRS